MAAASYLPSEDQFLCSICLEVFVDPITTPCGHNFCKNCISTHWDVTSSFQCPLCKDVFEKRPLLRVNTFISEMAALFRQSAQQETRSKPSEQQCAKPGEVSCDVCTGVNTKALQSCLDCLISYCETHLKPHLTVPGLKRHELVDPVQNLEGRLCAEHKKPLELFCKTDQTCVCILCSILDHKAHEFVPLREEYTEKLAELGKTEAKIERMIQMRRQKIQKMKSLVQISNEAADREKQRFIQVFTALKKSVERALNEHINTIDEQQRRTQDQAEETIKELEQEISALEERSTEVEQLSRSEDHLQVLQSFSDVNATPSTKEWTADLQPPLYEKSVVRALAQLEETLSKEMKMLRVQQYAVHPSLILSDDRKQVGDSDMTNNLPDNTERFSESLMCCHGRQERHCCICLSRRHIDKKRKKKVYMKKFIN